MKKVSIIKRLEDAESKSKQAANLRDEAAARAITPAQWEQLNLDFDAAQRAGKESEFVKACSTGQLLRLHRGREEWARQRAKEITPEYINQLVATGTGVDRFNDAELTAVAAGYEDDGICWDDLPETVLDAIETDPDAVDFDELRRLYPSKRKQ